MTKTTQDNVEGYRVKKEDLSGFDKCISSNTAVDNTPSPLVPARVIDEWQQPRELQPFLGGGPHWNKPVEGTQKHKQA